MSAYSPYSRNSSSIRTRPSAAGSSRTSGRAPAPSGGSKKKPSRNRFDLKTIIIIAEAVVILLLLIFGFGSSCSGCQDCSAGGRREKTSIENCLTEFQYACNTLDIRAMLNCIDPSVADPIRVSVGIYGTISDVDNDELLESFSQSITGEDIPEVDEFYQSINIEMLSARSGGKYGSASTTVYFTLFGEDIVRDATFEMVKDHGKWYISSFSLDT